MCDIRFFKSAYHCYDVAANLLKFYEQEDFEWNCYYSIFKKQL